MRKRRTIMDKSTAKLIVGGVAGLAALGVGQGTALAAGGNAPHITSSPWMRRRP
jgi:hypothetical protein